MLIHRCYSQLMHPNYATRISKLPIGKLYRSFESRRHQATDNHLRKSLSFEILKDNSRLIDESLRERINVDLDDLRVSPGDGSTMIFNLTWLRDSCHCNQCTHPHSRQRLYIAKDFRRDHFRISRVDAVLAGGDGIPDKRLVPGGHKGTLMRVEWSDGHESFYSMDWLAYVQRFCQKRQLDNLDTKKRLEFDCPQDDYYLPKLDKAIPKVQWTVEDISRGLRPVDCSDLLDGFKFNHETTFINANRIADMSPRRLGAIGKLSTDLVKYGLAKLVNVPCERDQVLKIARSLAYERPTGYGVVFDVVVEPSEQINLAYSSREFDLHSDLPYREMSPGVQLLHCISNTTHGGLSYFSDAFRAAKQLKDEHPRLYDALVLFPITFIVRDPYRDVDLRHHQPMLSLNHRSELEAVHYSPFTLPPIGHRDDVKLFYVAQDVFTSHLHSDENKLVTKMEPGDLYMFHNRRVLHGRSDYDATKSRRFLQGCYMDWDEISAIEEKLRSRDQHSC